MTHLRDDFNLTDRHDITEILLKGALSPIKQTNKQTKSTLSLVEIALLCFSLARILYQGSTWEESQALEYRINWDIYTPYRDVDGMLLHITGQFTMEELYIIIDKTMVFVGGSFSKCLNFETYTIHFAMI